MGLPPWLSASSFVLIGIDAQCLKSLLLLRCPGPQRFLQSRQELFLPSNSPSAFGDVFHNPFCSTAYATRRTVLSSKCFPSTCKPIGNPALVSPQGTLMPGMPTRSAV